MSVCFDCDKSIHASVFVEVNGMTYHTECYMSRVQIPLQDKNYCGWVDGGQGWQQVNLEREDDNWKN